MGSFFLFDFSRLRMRRGRGVRSSILPLIGILIASGKREYRQGPHEYLRKFGS